MYLDLKPVLSGETRKITFALPLDADAVGAIKKLFPDITDVSSADISGEVCNMSGYMVLRENALIKFSALCARCAETANSELSLSFEKCVATGDVSKDNDDYIFPEDTKLDITAPLFEEMLLEMPSKILCREDCRGLCPRCGKNLNEGDCGCKKSEGDPRLAILKTLLDK